MNENENKDSFAEDLAEENDDNLMDDELFRKEVEDFRKSYDENNNEKEKRFIESAYEWIDSFVVSLVAVILIFTFFIGKVRVDGDSMNNTLINDDQLLITDFNYEPKYGDIVIVSRNPSNLVEDELSTKEPIVKRVIATEGQTIEIKKGFVYVNDKRLDEPYIKDYDSSQKFNGNDTESIDLIGKQVVPKGRIFVMGDNRDNSRDSRFRDIYFIDKRYVLGKVLCRIYPFDTLRTF